MSSYYRLLNGEVILVLYSNAARGGSNVVWWRSNKRKKRRSPQRPLRSTEVTGSQVGGVTGILKAHAL